MAAGSRQAPRRAARAREAGKRLAARLELGNPPRLAVLHFEPALGSVAEAMLGRGLGERLGAPLEVRARALPALPISAADEDLADWLGRARVLRQALDEVSSLRGCVETPPEEAPKRRAPLARQRLRGAALAELATWPAERLTVTRGDRWSIRLSDAPCGPPAATATPPP